LIHKTFNDCWENLFAVFDIKEGCLNGFPTRACYKNYEEVPKQKWKKPQQYLLACGLLRAETSGVESHVSLATTQSFASLTWPPNYRFYFLFSIKASIQERQHQLLATYL